MRKLIFTTAAVIIATATFAATSAQAANPVFCQSYAQQAVWAESQNIADSCGYNGARWSFNYVGHYAWCLSVSKSMANAERYARKLSLINC